MESGGHHSDHRDDPPAQLQHPADDPRVPAEAALPENMAKNNDVALAWEVLLGKKRSTENRLDLEEPE